MIPFQNTISSEIKTTVKLSQKREVNHPNHCIAPMITKDVSVPKGKEASYERNRNLFYVCCSRAKKRLVFFVTLKTDTVFTSFLKKIAGCDNIFTYTQFTEDKTNLEILDN